MGRFNTDRLESKVNNIKTANEQFEKININDIIDCSDNHFPLTEIEELANDIAEKNIKKKQKKKKKKKKKKKQ